MKKLYEPGVMGSVVEFAAGDALVEGTGLGDTDEIGDGDVLGERLGLDDGTGERPGAGVELLEHAAPTASAKTASSALVERVKFMVCYPFAPWARL